MKKTQTILAQRPLLLLIFSFVMTAQAASPVVFTCQELFDGRLLEPKNYYAKLAREVRATVRARSNSGLENPVIMGQNEDGLILANGVRVTGDSKYSLRYVLRNLGLSEELLASLPSSAQVISVGEGLSHLGPYLTLKFPSTKFLDVWYDSPDLNQEMQDYVKAHRSQLVTGTSLNIPLADRSQDLVVCHRLLNNFFDDSQAAYKSMDEMTRILKPGGIALVEFVKLNMRREVEELVEKLKAKYGETVEIQIERWNPVEEPHFSDVGIEDFRLIVKRLR